MVVRDVTACAGQCNCKTDEISLVDIFSIHYICLWIVNFREKDIFFLGHEETEGGDKHARMLHLFLLPTPEWISYATAAPSYSSLPHELMK